MYERWAHCAPNPVARAYSHHLSPITYVCSQLKKLEDYKGNRALLSKADQFVYTVCTTPGPNRGLWL